MGVEIPHLTWSSPLRSQGKDDGVSVVGAPLVSRKISRPRFSQPSPEPPGVCGFSAEEAGPRQAPSSPRPATAHAGRCGVSLFYTLLLEGQPHHQPQTALVKRKHGCFPFEMMPTPGEVPHLGWGGHRAGAGDRVQAARRKCGLVRRKRGWGP